MKDNCRMGKSAYKRLVVYIGRERPRSGVRSGVVRSGRARGLPGRRRPADGPRQRRRPRPRRRAGLLAGGRVGRRARAPVRRGPGVGRRVAAGRARPRDRRPVRVGRGRRRPRIVADHRLHAGTAVIIVVITAILFIYHQGCSTGYLYWYLND